MTAVTFSQTVDKNIFKSTSSLFVVEMIALSLLRRNPATHGVFLGSPSSFVFFYKKRAAIRKGRLPIAARRFRLLSYSIDMLIAIATAALRDVRTVFAIHVVCWISLLPDWLNFVSLLMRDQ